MFISMNLQWTSRTVSAEQRGTSSSSRWAPDRKGGR